MISDLWNRLTESQPDPPTWLVLVTGAVALLLVVWQPSWRVLRNIVTIAHEGGHALAAVVTGRQLTGIRLHSDTSGVTLSRGKPRGPGMVLTGAAGYPAPPLVGLIAVVVLEFGRITALLWISLVVLGVMLVLIRNAYGVLSLVVTGAIVVGVSFFTPDDVQAAFAYFFAWFLLLAGTRPVVELQRLRRQGRAPSSDADQLAWLTRLPALFWVGVFGVIAIACLLLGATMLLPELPEFPSDALDGGR